MKNSVKFTLFIFLISIFSCTPKAPYEIKSPCVAIDSEHEYAITPCVRRPLNFNKAII